MATEHNEQTPSAASNEKQADFEIEIEDVDLEEVAGGSCVGCNSCGSGCKAPIDPL